MDALVVGAGEMGRWFGDVVAMDLAFADVDPDAADAAVAAARSDGRSVRAVDPDADEEFEVVCVAVPIPAAVEAIERHGPKASRAVVDVTGAMAAPVAAMARAAPDAERMSLHPLFAADAAPGNVAVTTAADGPVTEAVRETLTDRGNTLVEVTAAEHDRAMATVQGRAHAAVLAFALAADDVPAGLETPVYEALTDLVERVTGGSARVYADVQETFGGAAEVAAAAERLAEADHEAFATLYEDARN
jgi:prephenate dehydrogenase